MKNEPRPKCGWRSRARQSSYTSRISSSELLSFARNAGRMSYRKTLSTYCVRMPENSAPSRNAFVSARPDKAKAYTLALQLVILVDFARKPSDQNARLLSKAGRQDAVDVLENQGLRREGLGAGDVGIALPMRRDAVHHAIVKHHVALHPIHCVRPCSTAGRGGQRCAAGSASIGGRKQNPVHSPASRSSKYAATASAMASPLPGTLSVHSTLMVASSAARASLKARRSCAKWLILLDPLASPASVTPTPTMLSSGQRFGSSRSAARPSGAPQVPPARTRVCVVRTVPSNSTVSHSYTPVPKPNSFVNAPVHAR
eukprot:scaffold803_cov310-Pinguiococcus_pyrenoidosus.AAC.214